MFRLFVNPAVATGASLVAQGTAVYFLSRYLNNMNHQQSKFKTDSVERNPLPLSRFPSKVR